MENLKFQDVTLTRSWPHRRSDGFTLLVYFVTEQKLATWKPTFPKGLDDSRFGNVVEVIQLKLRQFQKTEGLSAPYNLALHPDLAVCILPIKESLESFEVHEVLRKQLRHRMVGVNASQMWLDVTGLGTRLQIKVIEGVCALRLLSSWRPTEFGQRLKKVKPLVLADLLFRCQVKPGGLRSSIRRSEVVAQSTNLVRTLADLPANRLNPKLYADIVRKRSRSLGYTTRFHDESTLKKLGAGAFLAVSAAAAGRGNGVLELSWKPKGKALGRVALVGKGICFDTGGYNVKTGSYMHGMHRDMTGSAVALAVFESLVKLQARVSLKAYLAIAENLISPEGFKPNEVVEAMDGTSIEIVDTDAEGRLVLSDTLAMASKNGTDLIVDFATLTGAAHRAIGTKRSCVFSNNKKLLSRAVSCGGVSGERLWGFPIGEDYQDALRSDIADTLQCLNVPGPDHIMAATFLSRFVGATPWVHVDLSSDSHKGGLGLVETETTGFGVRWGVEFIAGEFKGII